VSANPIRFVPLDAADLERWHRPTRYDWLPRLPCVPVADTELLHLGHYAPLVLDLTEALPRVVLLLDPGLLRTPLTLPDGRWRAPYAPMALRALPFGFVSPAGQTIGIAPELAARGEGAGEVLRADMRNVPAFAPTALLLERLQAGSTRLSEAAKMLLAADVCAPLVLPETSLLRDRALFALHPERMRRLSARQAAAFSVDQILGLDLLAACLFSQRHLSREVRLEIETDGEVHTGRVPASHDVPEPLDLPMLVDDSPLFSFEQFTQARAAHHGNA